MKAWERGWMRAWHKLLDLRNVSCTYDPLVRGLLHKLVHGLSLTPPPPPICGPSIRESQNRLRNESKEKWPYTRSSTFFTFPFILSLKINSENPTRGSWWMYCTGLKSFTHLKPQSWVSLTGYWRDVISVNQTGRIELLEDLQTCCFQS